MKLLVTGLADVKVSFKYLGRFSILSTTYLYPQQSYGCLETQYWGFDAYLEIEENNEKD